MVLSNIALTAGIMSISLGIISCVIDVMFFQRYIERKQTSTLYLAFSVLSWIGAMWSSAIIYLMAGVNLNLAIMAQKLVYAFVFGGTISTFLFAHKIFFEKVPKKWLYLYVLIGIIVIIVLFSIDSVDITSFPDGSNYPLLTIVFDFSIVVVLYIIPTIIAIFILALKTARKIEEHMFKIGFKIIAAGQIMILCTFIVDTLASVFIADVLLYMTFLYLTWVFPALAIIFYYLGWIMPDWLRKKLGNK